MKRLFAAFPIRKGSNDEKRRVNRRAVGIRAALREQGAARFAVDVIDLSVAGFRAETGFSLKPGQTVWVTLPGLASLEATVAWRDKYRYGCAFRVPMHPAILDHLVAASWR